MREAVSRRFAQIQADLYSQEDVGGARPRRDTKRRLLILAKFALGRKSVARRACTRYFDPGNPTTGNFGGVATVSDCGGNSSPFRDFPYPPETPGNEDESANEKEAWPSLRRTATGPSRQAKLTMRSGLPSPFTSPAAIRSPPEGATKSTDRSPPSPS